jgi:tRNA(Arg) A34 adenosine deaminase TadA
VLLEWRSDHEAEGIDVDDVQAMARSIELARLSAERGNHPFGCVITLGGELLVESENFVITDLDPTGHAEIAAIRKACQARGSLDLSGCTLYTSCEPCWMCSTAIRRTGISRVVFALTSASRSGGYSSDYPILSTLSGGFAAPPEIVYGFMAEQSQAVWKAVNWPR